MAPTNVVRPIAGPVTGINVRSVLSHFRFLDIAAQSLRRTPHPRRARVRPLSLTHILFDKIDAKLEYVIEQGLCLAAGFFGEIGQTALVSWCERCCNSHGAVPGTMDTVIKRGAMSENIHRRTLEIGDRRFRHDIISHA